MRNRVFAYFMVLLWASSAFAQQWSPTPMVIDVKDMVYYDGNGEADIPFSLEGKNAKIWLVIESNLDYYYGERIERPVALQNGLKGWHFVNGIDTTVYVSPARAYDVGTNIFPVGPLGVEVLSKDAQKTVSENESIMSPTFSYLYTYYLWGYDSESNSELAIDFLPIGSYWEGQYLRFYPYDETGAPYEAPMLMGQLPQFLTRTISTEYNLEIGRGDIFKWQLGNDPTDTYLLETSAVWGFEPGDVVEDQMVGYGAGIFDPRDHDVFYFAKSHQWNQTQTVVKYHYVVDGMAIEDTNWGGYDNVSWAHPATDGDNSTHSVLHHLGDEYLVMLDGGTNPMAGQHDRLHAFSIDDPTDEVFDIQLDEFYMPNQPENPSNGASRTSSALNQLFPGRREGTFFVSGTYTCLTELIDVSRLIEAEGNLDPYADDGSGYVVWANSNGDFFFDMAPYPDPEHPDQLWACIVSEPHNVNHPRRELQPADMNGFLVSFSEFTGLNSFGVYCPDGTGIDLARLADDEYFPTGTQYGDQHDRQRGGGELLDYGGQFDGLYKLAPLIPDPDLRYGNVLYLKTMWVAFDSDSGSFVGWDELDVSPDIIDAVEDAPETFSVSQNSPNPFNPSTAITFSLAESGPVTVEVYNVAGQKVETLVDADMDAGSHTVTWNAGAYSTGIYFYAVRAGEYSKTMKMTLVK